MKRIFKLLLIFALLIGINRFCHLATGTFSIHKIVHNRAEDPIWVPAMQNENVDALLREPFTYLGHGNESFAFLSADKTTVLKCFKLQFLRPAYLKELLRTFPTEWKSTMIEARKTRLARTFDSLKIAHDQLAEETALLYIHLRPTRHIKKEIVLIDKLGIRHTLSANQLKFVLQKRADPFYPTLKKWARENNQSQLHLALRSLIDLVTKRSLAHIHDRDATIGTNFGWINGKAIEIDIGSYSKGETIDVKREILYVLSPLWLWAEKEAPQLIPILDHELGRALSALPAVARNSS